MKNAKIIWRVIALVVFCPLLSVINGQEIDLEINSALAYARQGDHTSADHFLNQLYNDNPDSEKIQVAIAYNNSWDQQYELAISQFENILKLNPKNVDALKGYGYVLAWKGEYAAAKYPFIEMIRLGAEKQEAKKALAYIYLWQGNFGVACNMFSELLDLDPQNAEYHTALGQCNLSQYKTKSARNLFEKALSVDPNYHAARKLLELSEFAPSFLDLDILAGYSTFNDLSKFGIRSAVIKWQVDHKWRIIGQFDNGHTLDNLFLLSNQQNAEAIWLGVYRDWSKTTATKIQFGHRFFDDQKNQSQVFAQQIWYLNSGISIQAGGSYLFSERQNNVTGAQLGLYVPITRSWSMHPTYWVTLPANEGYQEHRFLLSNNLKFRNRYEFSFGVLMGSRTGNFEITSETISGFQLGTRIPATRNIQVLFNGRYESDFPGNQWVVGAGLNIRFEK